jgi:hypothetical protein
MNPEDRTTITSTVLRDDEITGTISFKMLK